MTAAVLARTTRRSVAPAGGRREVTESEHRGHLVVAGPDGQLHGLGVLDRPTFIRSAAKPFQSAAALELLDEDLPPAEVAVSWASHRGLPHQLEVVRSLLRRAGVPEDRLTTPPAEGDGTRPPTRLGHNCSGQHALFALVGSRRGLDRSELLPPDGPLQEHVLHRMSTWLGPPTAVSVDGCGSPAVAVPLAALALAYRDLVSGSDDLDLSAAVRAGLGHPDLIGGDGRLETSLLAAGVVAKPGAEGVFAVGWNGPDGPRGAAVKVDDGAGRAASAAVHALLRAAGVDLAWDPPPVLGGGRPVGRVVADGAVAALVTGLPAAGGPP